MKTKQSPFWKSKPLEEMTQDEWESLCDGCGICCLQKIEDDETGEIQLTSVACAFLDTMSCRCRIYEVRLSSNPECIGLVAGKVQDITWLPETCAYRLLAEGRDLEWWHPLVSGEPSTVHEAGISIRNRVISGRFIHPEDFRGQRSD
jgi:uncharacterized cysteine cluster protein YcgN (CxxCxxCC family)